MGLISSDVADYFRGLSAGKLARTNDHLLLAEMKIPGYGPVKCRQVMECCKTLDNLFTMPSVMVYGITTLTKPAQEHLKAFLDDPDARHLLANVLQRRMHLKKAPEPIMEGFKLKPVLEQIVGYRIRGRAPAFIYDRWMRGISLKDAIIKRSVYATTMSDGVHWELVRAMYPTERQEAASSVCQHRMAFNQA